MRIRTRETSLPVRLEERMKDERLPTRRGQGHRHLADCHLLRGGRVSSLVLHLVSLSILVLKSPHGLVFVIVTEMCRKLLVLRGEREAATVPSAKAPARNALDSVVLLINEDSDNL